MSPTEGISHFVDYHLAPLVKNIPSYIKDTTDFLNKLRTISNVPSGTLLATLDVKSSYLFIYLHILTKNNFVFEGEHYLQIQGTVMGRR